MTLFLNEEEMQEFSKHIAKLFWQEATVDEVYNFIEGEFVPLHLIRQVRIYLNHFDYSYWTVLLSYARLNLRDRYKVT